ncbi:MAG: winged helix-turn-helix transcriptional regulator, partial [Solobacterium sp.]|nr:winged helix-turn-helix transcriptional regulator [Solobacterium sp.]
MKRDKEKPAYMQLYQKVREEIVEGVYAYGTKIPSKRNMSLETGTSLITVEHAYDLLAEEGYIESRERSGYFVIYRSEDLFSVAEGKRKDLTHALS